MDRSLPNRMIRAARLESQLYEEVEHDESAISQAAIVVTLAAISGGIASVIRADILTAVVGVIGSLIGWVLWSAITYFVGKTFFATAQTQIDMGEMLRALGFASTPGILGFLGFVPGVGGLISFALSIWTLIAGVIAVRQALDVDTGRAIGTVLVGWLVQFVLSFLLALVLLPFFI